MKPLSFNVQLNRKGTCNDVLGHSQGLLLLGHEEVLKLDIEYDSKTLKCLPLFKETAPY